MDILRKDRDHDVTTAPPLAQSRDERAATILGEDTEFNGTLKFSNTLRIEGRFKGEMHSEGQLIVAKTGVVEAEISVGAIQVDGKIMGNITATDLVELRATAEVHGDITAARLKIDDGVVFVGRADVKPAGRRSESVPRPAQAPKDAAQPSKDQPKSPQPVPAKKD